MTTYNKLIRNKLPELLTKEGVEFETEKILDEVRFFRLLLDELELASQNAALTFDGELLTELANIETVIDEILKLKGFTREDLNKRQSEQDSIGGTYSEKLFLKEITTEGISKEEPDEEEES